ncbi:MAG TPA: MBL fold metallo-hydrolase [Gammaproteobacteria bacterium]
MCASRRQFLRALGAGSVAVAGLSALAPLRAQKPEPSLALAELRDGLLLVAGAGSNVVVLPGPDGLLVVDSGAPQHAAALERFIAAEISDAPVQLLFNTHWHLEHTGGNEVLARPGTTIVAHENTRLWMTTKFYVDWEDRRYLPRPPEAHPNKTFFSHEPQPLEATFAGDTVLYGHLREAHTDGDVYVRFPDRNVIVAGGAVTARRYPLLDYITGGWIGGLEEVTRRLIDMCDADTLVVPEAGPPQRRADLEAQLEMVATVRRRIEEMALEGHGIDEMIAANITKDFDSRFSGDSALFIANAYHGMWQGRLRGTVA